MALLQRHGNVFKSHVRCYALIEMKVALGIFLRISAKIPSAFDLLHLQFLKENIS